MALLWNALLPPTTRSRRCPGGLKGACLCLSASVRLRHAMARPLWQQRAMRCWRKRPPTHRHKSLLQRPLFEVAHSCGACVTNRRVSSPMSPCNLARLLFLVFRRSSACTCASLCLSSPNGDILTPDKESGSHALQTFPLRPLGSCDHFCPSTPGILTTNKNTKTKTH